MQNKTIASVAAISLMATFMSGCAGLPKLYNDDYKKVCRLGDTFQECCEKRELQKKKDKKIYNLGSCQREGGGNDHETPTTDTPDKPDQPDSEPPSDQPRDNPDHDHDHDNDHDDGDKDDDRDGGPGQGKGPDKGDKDAGDNDKGEHNGGDRGNKGDNHGHDNKDSSREGGPGREGRDHSAIKRNGPVFA